MSTLTTSHSSTANHSLTNNHCNSSNCSFNQHASSLSSENFHLHPNKPPPSRSYQIVNTSNNEFSIKQPSFQFFTTTNYYNTGMDYLQKANNCSIDSARAKSDRQEALKYFVKSVSVGDLKSIQSALELLQQYSIDHPSRTSDGNYALIAQLLQRLCCFPNLMADKAEIVAHVIQQLFDQTFISRKQLPTVLMQSARAFITSWPYCAKVDGHYQWAKTSLLPWIIAQAKGNNLLCKSILMTVKLMKVFTFNQYQTDTIKRYLRFETLPFSLKAITYIDYAKFVLQTHRQNKMVAKCAVTFLKAIIEKRSKDIYLKDIREAYRLVELTGTSNDVIMKTLDTNQTMNKCVNNSGSQVNNLDDKKEKKILIKNTFIRTSSIRTSSIRTSSQVIKILKQQKKQIDKIKNAISNDHPSLFQKRIEKEREWIKATKYLDEYYTTMASFLRSAFTSAESIYGGYSEQGVNKNVGTFNSLTQEPSSKQFIRSVANLLVTVNEVVSKTKTPIVSLTACGITLLIKRAQMENINTLTRCFSDANQRNAIIEQLARQLCLHQKDKLSDQFKKKPNVTELIVTGISLITGRDCRSAIKQEAVRDVALILSVLLRDDFKMPVNTQTCVDLLFQIVIGDNVHYRSPVPTEELNDSLASTVTSEDDSNTIVSLQNMIEKEIETSKEENEHLKKTVGYMMDENKNKDKKIDSLTKDNQYLRKDNQYLRKDNQYLRKNNYDLKNGIALLVNDNKKKDENIKLLINDNKKKDENIKLLINDSKKKDENIKLLINGSKKKDENVNLLINAIEKNDKKMDTLIDIIKNKDEKIDQLIKNNQ